MLNKRKILISVVLSMVFVLIMCLCSCGSEYEEENGIAFYLNNDGTYSVGCGEDKEIEEAIIPETYKGKKVTAIKDEGFFNCYMLGTERMYQRVILCCHLSHRSIKSS